MLRVFLISVLATVLCQPRVQILGMDFNVVKILEISERELVVDFGDKSIVTTPEGLDEIVLSYYLQAQKMPPSQLEEFIERCIKANKYTLCDLALQHYCSPFVKANSKLDS